MAKRSPNLLWLNGAAAGRARSCSCGHEPGARARPAIPRHGRGEAAQIEAHRRHAVRGQARDRKSTRLNSSHVEISYAVFCLKKKKNKNNHLISRRKKTKNRNRKE